MPGKSGWKDDTQNNGNRCLRFRLHLFCCAYGSLLDRCIANPRPVQTFFDSAPFHDKSHYQIVRLITNGERPDRLESPRMEDDTWHLIQKCWEPIPSKRSTIKDIATALAS